jgi:hypothetical protein
MAIRAEPNAYSRRWFEFFHIGIHEGRTIQEVDICLPLCLVVWKVFDATQ